MRNGFFGVLFLLGTVPWGQRVLLQTAAAATKCFRGFVKLNACSISRYVRTASRPGLMNRIGQWVGVAFSEACVRPFALSVFARRMGAASA